MKSQSYSVGVGEAGVEKLRPVYLNGFKRAFDIVFSLMVLPFLAPIIAIMYVVVRMDGGTGFFGQERVGLNGRVFKCWKLRSMVTDAEKALADACARCPKVAEEWERMQKLEDDPRITRVGRFIRKFPIHELPQLWNVLIGDMSLVGPRPALPVEVAKYSSVERRRLRGKPGITCFWQIMGRADLAFDRQVVLDVAYLQKRSIWMDIAILFRTPLAVLTARGAY